MPLKILHILDHSLPLHDGYALRSHNILQAQYQQGWQPVALTSSKHEASDKQSQHCQVTIDGCRYYRTGALPPIALPFEAERRLMSALGRRIREIIALEKPDLLHAHSPLLNALPLLRVGRQLGLPVIYEIRAFWEDAAVDQGTYGHNSWKYKLVRAAEAWVCHKVDQVAVLCQGLREDLIKRGIPAEKLTVVYNGVNIDAFKAWAPDGAYQQRWNLAGKKVIGFIGSFYRYEGLDLLIDAMPHLANCRSDIVLLLVGSGEVEVALRAQVHKLGLQDKVIMPGNIPHARIPGIYGLIDVLVYPRYATRLTELVTPLKPLEAMAMGKALVASDIGGHREFIDHGRTGLLFAPGNIPDLVAALSRLLRDEAYCQSLAQQGNLWVRQEHTWEKTTAVYEAIYAKARGLCCGHS